MGYPNPRGSPTPGGSQPLGNPNPTSGISQPLGDPNSWETPTRGTPQLLGCARINVRSRKGKYVWKQLQNGARDPLTCWAACSVQL